MGRVGPVSPGRGGCRWHAPRNGHNRSLQSVRPNTPRDRNAGDGVPYGSTFIRRADTSDRSGGFTRLPPSTTYQARIGTGTAGRAVSARLSARTIHQARVWPPALPGVPYGPNSIRRADTSDRSGGFCLPFGSHNPSGTSLAPGPAGFTKNLVYFLCKVCYTDISVHRGWADPGKIKRNTQAITRAEGPSTRRFRVKGDGAGRLELVRFFWRTHPIFCLLNERSTVLLPPSQREGDREAVEGVS